MYRTAAAYILHALGVPVTLFGAPFLFRYPRLRVPVMAAVGLVIAFEIGLYRYFVPYSTVFIVVGVGEVLYFTVWWFVSWAGKPSPRGFPLLPLIVIVIVAGDGWWFRYAHSHRHMPGTRSKVARAKSEIRNLSVSLENYYIDHDTYPPAVDLDGKLILFEDSDTGVSSGYVPWMLTTPKAYTLSLPQDPFNFTKGVGFGGYRYATNGLTCWIMTSRGPDRDDDMPIEEYPDLEKGNCNYRGFMSHFGGPAIEFDGTNGTMSKGDVLRVGP